MASSVQDSRNFGHFPNHTITVQGTVTYTVPAVECRTQGAPVDSRTGVPIDSRHSPNIPQNSRT